MISRILYKGYEFHVDLHNFFDLSIPVRKSGNVQCWYEEPPRIEPVRIGEWIGEVQAGAPVNFRNIFFNPHAHVTHTECLGHIAPEWISVYHSQKNFFSIAEVLSVLPSEEARGDRVILPHHIEPLTDHHPCTEALIIRTLNNGPEKFCMHYTHTNPPYLHPDTMHHIVQQGIIHLLIDLPSVDREKDEGKLLAHKIFWNYPDNPRHDATITELIYVPNHIADGIYLLNLMTGPFDNDASPSRPILYPILSQRKL